MRAWPALVNKVGRPAPTLRFSCKTLDRSGPASRVWEVKVVELKRRDAGVQVVGRLGAFPILAHQKVVGAASAAAVVTLRQQVRASSGSDPAHLAASGPGLHEQVDWVHLPRPTGRLVEPLPVRPPAWRGCFAPDQVNEGDGPPWNPLHTPTPATISFVPALGLPLRKSRMAWDLL